MPLPATRVECKWVCRLPPLPQAQPLHKDLSVSSRGSGRVRCGGLAPGAHWEWAGMGLEEGRVRGGLKL